MGRLVGIHASASLWKDKKYSVRTFPSFDMAWSAQSSTFYSDLSGQWSNEMSALSTNEIPSLPTNEMCALMGLWNVMSLTQLLFDRGIFFVLWALVVFKYQWKPIHRCSGFFGGKMRTAGRLGDSGRGTTVLCTRSSLSILHKGDTCLFFILWRSCYSDVGRYDRRV